MLSKDDLDAIAAAVTAAERRTSGEIVCAVAQRVSDYAEVPLAWAAAAALILPPVALALGLRPLAVSGAFGDWIVGHMASMDDTVAAALAAFGAVQAAVFGVAWLLFSIPAVRRAVTPGWIKTRRVRQAAFAQYAATGLAVRDDLTGVVVFASLDDRRVEVIADPLIHAKVGQDAWAPVAATVTNGMRRNRPGEGLAQAVALCGDILAAHFPDDGAANRLADRPIVS